MCELGIDKIRFFRRRKAGLDMGICWKRNNEIRRATTTSVSNHLRRVPVPVLHPEIERPVHDEIN